MSKPLRSSRHRFWKTHLGNSGDWSCLELAAEPSPPHDADGSSAADTPPSGFPAVGRWKAPPDCSFDQRAEGALHNCSPAALTCTCALTSGTSSHPLLSLPLSTACCISPCCHTPRRCKSEHSAYEERSGITTHRRF